MNRSEFLSGTLVLGGKFPEQARAQETMVKKSCTKRRDVPFSFLLSKEALHGIHTFAFVPNGNVASSPQFAQRTLVSPLIVRQVPGSYSLFLKEQKMQ